MIRGFLAVLSTAWLVSCGADPSAAGGSAAASGSSVAAVASAQASPMTLEQRCNTKYGYYQDDKGNWKPRDDRRSSFDGAGASAYFQGAYQTKDCATPTFRNTAWWGSKDYTARTIQSKNAGVNHSARADGSRSREDGSVSPADSRRVVAGNVSTRAAGEGRKGPLKAAAASENETPEKSYVPPTVVDWQEQRALSVDQTKSLLGR